MVRFVVRYCTQYTVYNIQYTVYSSQYTVLCGPCLWVNMVVCVDHTTGHTLCVLMGTHPYST